VATVTTQLAGLRSKQGRYDESVDFARRTLALAPQIPPSRRRLIAVSRSHLGAAHYAKGQYADAWREMEAARAAYVECEGENSVNATTMTGNLAVLAPMVGRADRADALHQEVIARKRKERGERSPAVAVALTNYSVYLLNAGQPAQAEPHFREALAIKEDRMGAGHPETATSHRGLGDALMLLGRRDESRRHLERALEIQRTALAPGHTGLVATLCSLGQLLAADPATAVRGRELLEEARAAGAALGAHHPLTRRIAREIERAAQDARDH
jgi:tetratricopeptide (TPR) repeat protein